MNLRLNDHVWCIHAVHSVKYRFLESDRDYWMSVGFRTNANQSEVIPLESQTLELGNSDRIRLKFGSYGIEVKESGERIRVSNLYRTHHGIRTNRTNAVVHYPTAIDPAFKKEHDAIQNGQSIGIVFKNFHWLIV